MPASPACPHIAVRPRRPHHLRARAARARTRSGCVLGLSAGGEAGRRKGGDGLDELLLDDPLLERMLEEVCGDDTDVGGADAMSPGSS